MLRSQNTANPRTGIVFLILAFPLMAGAFFASGWSWGWDHLSRIHPFAVVALGTASVLLWTPPGRGLLSWAFDRGGGLLARAPMRMSALLGLLGLASFSVWPIATRIYGDSLHILQSHSAENLNAYAEEILRLGPLARGRASFILHDLVARAGGFSYERSYLIISALCGGLFIFALVRLAGTLPGINRWERALIVWIGLADGANQLFFGHVESYTVPRLLGSLFLIGVIRSLFEPKPTRWRFGPAIWFGLAVCFHIQTLVLLPTFLLWWLREVGANRPRLRSLLAGKTVAVGLFVAVAVVTVAYFALGSSCYDYIYSGGRPRAHEVFLPWTTDCVGLPYLKYTLFSGPHVLDLIGSLYSISSPAILLVLILFSAAARHDRRFLILASSVLTAALHNFSLNPAIGFPFDWDMMSVLSLPLLFTAVFLVARSKVSLNLLPAVVILGLGTLTVHAVNAHEPLVRERVEDMGVWLHRTYYGGSHYRISANLSTIEDLDEQVAERKRVLERLSSQAYPEDREVAFLWEKLAVIEIDRQKYEEALAAYRHSVATEPRQWMRLKPLGYLEVELGDPAAGVQLLERYLESVPQDAEAWLFRGDGFARLGTMGRAVESWQRFLALAPSAPVAARVRADLERIQKSTRRE